MQGRGARGQFHVNFIFYRRPQILQVLGEGPDRATGVRGPGSLAAFIDVCRLREKLEPASSRSSMVALVSDFIKRLDVEGLRRQEMVFFHSVKPMLAERASDLPSALKELGERRSR